MTLGEIISNYRKEHGEMSMREFSRNCGLSVTYISSLENNKTPRGKAPTPTIDTYRAVAKAMGMDVEDLIRAVDDKIVINHGMKIIPDKIYITSDSKDPYVEMMRQITRPNLSPARQALLDAVDGMNEEQIKKLLKMIELAKEVVKE